MCPRGARMIAGQGGLLETARLVCHCLLVEGAGELILVDTGFGLDDTRKPRQLGRPFTPSSARNSTPPIPPSPRSAHSGFDPSDVRHILMTHLDLDHAGGLPDFPDAEVHLLGRELAAAIKPRWSDQPRYIAAHWGHGPPRSSTIRRRALVRLRQRSPAAWQRRRDTARAAPRPHVRAHRHRRQARRRLAAALRRRLLPPRLPAHAPLIARPACACSKPSMRPTAPRGCATTSGCASSRTPTLTRSS